MALMRPSQGFFALGRMFNPGQVFHDDDPVVVAFPALFVPVQPTVVESASAAPGEQRSTTRTPAKKAAKKKT